MSKYNRYRNWYLLLLNNVQRYYFKFTPQEKEEFKRCCETEDYQALQTLCKKKELEALRSFVSRPKPVVPAAKPEPKVEPKKRKVKKS